MKVVLTPEAVSELGAIWNWNAENQGVRQADDYLAFLTKSIHNIGNTYARGRAVETRPDLRYIQVKKRSQGHGHVAVYLIEEDQVLVVHVFHTAQNWPDKLSE